MAVEESEKHFCGAFRGMKSVLDNSMKACGGQVDNAEAIRTKTIAIPVSQQWSGRALHE